MAGSAGGGWSAARVDGGGSREPVGTADARRAGALFEECEGCDLDPAAEVALAGLERAVRSGVIGPQDRVLLNLTGGGSHRLPARGGGGAPRAGGAPRGGGGRRAAAAA